MTTCHLKCWQAEEVSVSELRRLRDIFMPRQPLADAAEDWFTHEHQRTRLPSQLDEKSSSRQWMPESPLYDTPPFLILAKFRLADQPPRIDRIRLQN